MILFLDEMHHQSNCSLITLSGTLPDWPALATYYTASFNENLTRQLQ